MKVKYLPFVAVLVTLASHSWAKDWTKDEQELLEWEESCLAALEFDAWADCFHEDFVGWGIGYPAPQTKPERASLAADSFERTDVELMLFKPLSVQMYGNTAVINYVVTFKIVNKKTEEVAIETSMWTDVCMKDGGKWHWIADHGSPASDD